MRRIEPNYRGIAAVTAALALSATGAFAQKETGSQEAEKTAADKKPGKGEVQKKDRSPAPNAAKKGSPREPAKKSTERKVEVRVRAVGEKESGKPVAEKRQALQIVRAHGRELKPRPWLGIAMRPIPESIREYLDLAEGFGVQVEHIVADSPADAAGLEIHDVLIQLDDQRVISPEHVALLVRSKKKGAKLEVRFIRKGKEQTVEVALGERALPPFSNAPMHARPHPPRGGLGDDHSGAFEFRFGEPGKEGHLEFQLPGDRKDHEEIRGYLEGYGEILKQWMKKNPDAMQFWNRPEPKEPQKSTGGVPPKPKPTAPRVVQPKPIPSLPGKSATGKPPAIMVRPGFPLEIFGGKGIIKIDNPKGNVTITADDGKHKITIKNTAGETVYEGSFNDGSKGLPKEARDQLKEMKLDDLQLPKPKQPKADAPPSGAKSKGKGEIL